jgi:sterol carrier protein 2
MVVTIYQRADGKEAPKVGEYRPEGDGRCRLGIIRRLRRGV